MLLAAVLFYSMVLRDEELIIYGADVSVLDLIRVQRMTKGRSAKQFCFFPLCNKVPDYYCRGYGDVTDKIAIVMAELCLRQQLLSMKIHFNMAPACSKLRHSLHWAIT